MVIQTTIVEMARDGTLKLPPKMRQAFRRPQQLSITRVGTSLVLAPVPDKWTRAAGRVIKYQNGLIVRDPKVMFGTPVIVGTRIPARTIAGYVDSGYSPEEIRKEFPFLTDSQIDAARKFARRKKDRRA
jgi:uncharacterized protein (DUF433 family)